MTTLEIPAMPAGDWVVRVDLTLREGGTTVTVPYYMRVSVTGEPVPSPTQDPSCGGID